MSFDALIQKVKQAEAALEAKERQTAADWRQLKSSWRSLWTPGRILLAGLASGFALGKLEPIKRVASGGGALQLITALAGLFAGGSAQAAANEAGNAADQAEQATAGTPGASPYDRTGSTATSRAAPPSAEATQRLYREAGLP